MNFYSLSGSNLDNYSPQNQNSKIYENFDNPNNSCVTDNNYQCSDSYSVSGTDLNSPMSNSNVNNCKTECLSSNDCVGFNFDNTSNTCNLKKSANSISNTNSNSTLCIKKNAGTNKCTIKNNDDKVFNELDFIFNRNNSENNMYSSPIGGNSNTFTPKNLMEQDISRNLQPSMNVNQYIPENSPSSYTPIYDKNMPENPPSSYTPIYDKNMSENPTSSYTPIYDQNIPMCIQPIIQPIMPGANVPSYYTPTQPNMPGANVPTYYTPTQPNMMDDIPQSLNPNNTLYPLPIPSSENMSINNKCNLDQNDNEKPAIYVDLSCFLNNINVLKNHSDNIMVDLNLITANIKSCSYVSKKYLDNTAKDMNNNTINNSISNTINNITNESTKKDYLPSIIDKIATNIEIPKPSTVKLYNVPASVLVASTPENDYSRNVMDLTRREPFENISCNWSLQDIAKIILIIIILIILINNK